MHYVFIYMYVVVSHTKIYYHLLSLIHLHTYKHTYIPMTSLISINLMQDVIVHIYMCVVVLHTNIIVHIYMCLVVLHTNIYERSWRHRSPDSSPTTNLMIAHIRIIRMVSISTPLIMYEQKFELFGILTN